MSTAPSTPEVASLRTRPLWWVGGLVLLGGMGVTLLVMLMRAGVDATHYTTYLQGLINFNMAIALALGLLILWLLVRLGARWRARKFGSRLLAKLALIFALLGVVPGALIYAVSVQFVSRSIETWFDVRVEGALRAGLSLGTNAIALVGKDLRDRVKRAVSQPGRDAAWMSPVQLERWREQLAAQEVVAWTSEETVLASAGNGGYSLTPKRPGRSQFQSARQLGVTSWVEGVDELEWQGGGNPMVVVLMYQPGSGTNFTAQAGYVQVRVPLAEQLVQDALNVQQANREYQERALAREGLRRMYLATLTLALFLTVFGAMVVAAVLGGQLVRPLLLLAAGVRDVAHGDLTPKLASTSKDELGELTRAFADMTGQLADARNFANSSLQSLERARASVATILENLTAGVLVFDAQRCITHVNPGAVRILAEPMLPWIATPGPQSGAVADWLRAVMAHFDALIQESELSRETHWQDTFELHLSSAPGPRDGPQSQALMLMARGARLPDDGYLVVFDDITDVMSAQRVQAWHEVARRLAHEIKNPLTPIQLSAERLARKLDGRLPEADQALLDKSVRTIVQQVDAMQRMVNEFRDFSRLPQAKLQPLDLNALLRETLSMYDGSVVRVTQDLGPDLPRIRGDAQQLRQVIHNLVQNGQDACEQAASLGPVEVRTRLSDAGDQVHLIIVDTGAGFADHVLRRAFEPYVTTKAKGTGLGLVMVKKIADEHHARVRLRNREEQSVVRGAVVSVSFPITAGQT